MEGWRMLDKNAAIGATFLLLLLAIAARAELTSSHITCK